MKELDREKLVDAYFERIPGGNAGLFDDEYLTEGNKRDEMNDFITYLSGVKAEKLECDENFVLLAYPHYDDMDYRGRATHSLICTDSIDADCRSEYDYNQCYNTSTHGEIVGLNVADTPYTQRHIYELMAQVVYEALRFGFNQERLPEKYSKLEEPYGVWYKDRDYYFSELEQLPDESCDEPGDEPDIKKYSLYMDVYAAIIRFNSYCRAKEILALKDCLQGELFLRENLPWMMAEAGKKMKK